MAEENDDPCLVILNLDEEEEEPSPEYGSLFDNPLGGIPPDALAGLNQSPDILNNVLAVTNESQLVSIMRSSLMLAGVSEAQQGRFGSKKIRD